MKKVIIIKQVNDLEFLLKLLNKKGYIWSDAYHGGSGLDLGSNSITAEALDAVEDHAVGIFFEGGKEISWYSDEDGDLKEEINAGPYETISLEDAIGNANNI